MKSIEVEDCTDVPGADSGAYGHGGVPRLSCVVIGRAALADLRICEHYSEHEVAVRHLKIVLEGGALLAICLARMGMAVNGKTFPQSAQCQLNQGDVVKLGRRVEIHVDGVPQEEDDRLTLRVMNEACDEGHYAFRLAGDWPLTVNRDVRCGSFRVLRQVGERSQNAVFKAVCEKDGIEGVPVGMVVALEVMKVATGEGGNCQSWFQRQSAMLKDLAHPGTVRYFGGFLESGPFGDVHVLVTEWLEGETLRDRLSRNPEGLDADEVLRTGEQVLSALAYVSSVGIVHRNIKPESIFLCKDGTVKLVDFELSQAGDRANGPEAGECGAFPYLAPDFLDPTFHGDEQSDIFSFGVCLHEMLTGRLPFPSLGKGRDLLDWTVRWPRRDEDVDPAEISESVVLLGAADVLAKALRRKREERFGSFVEFAAAFKGMKYRELSHDGTTWRLLKLVGRGGFGDVFKARDVTTGQVVAIKRLLMSQYANRLRGEGARRAFALLNDSSIVRFISFFEKRMGGSHEAFLVMEYLDGMPGSALYDVLKRVGGKPLSRTLVLRAFARYAHGLSVLRAIGLVRGSNIKPSNLYFPEKAIDRAAIMDWAVVRDPDGGISEMARTFDDYVPPEIAYGPRRCVEDGGDVYALGLSLYEALSGKTAYPRLPRGSKGLEVFFYRARNKTRPNLDESSYSDLPDLVRLVREMTEPDVDKRLKDAAEVERRLRALLPLEAATDDPGVDAPEPQTLYAAPPYEELELGGNDEKACTIDDRMYYWNSDEGKKALARQHRKQRFEQMCSYLVKGLVIMAALLVSSGAVVGLFWWGESCVRDTLPGLKGSLAVRVLALFPWLFALVWSEMKINRLPNLLTVGCLLSGIGVSAFENGVTMLSSIGAAVVGAAVLLPFFLSKAVCAGTVKMFAAAMAFWGIRCIPFAFASFLCMALSVCLVGYAWRCWFVKLKERHVPSSPIVLGSMLSLAVALWSWNGHGMLGGYIFMAVTLVFAAVARLLFSGRKQCAEVASKPSSTCEGEIAPPHEDSRTITLTGSESYGLQDETCRESDDLVSETEDGTDDPSAFLNLHGHATVHGFRLDPTPFVAEGGQGRVFKAECVEEGRLGLHKSDVVALKFVEETPSSPSFEEFRKAVEYLREIKSRHVPRYYGCFEVERVVDGKTKRFRMTVMEYLDGADLGYRVKVRSPMFYADEIMYVLDQLLEGLCELSEAGIVHRDIKPSNVFICRDGTVKLIDFDTALIHGIDLCPKNRKIVGTPEFAAPDYLTEGFRGDEISDVFSVGMTLYYMVHGLSPHRAKGTLDGRMGTQVFRLCWDKQEPTWNDWWMRDVKPYGDWLSGEPRGYVPLLRLRQLFEQSLAVDRKKRFASLLKFRQALSEIEFVQAKWLNRCIRVISDAQCIDSCGFGYGYVYGRDASGCVVNWTFRPGELFNSREEKSVLLRILCEKMYDPDVTEIFRRNVFGIWVLGGPQFHDREKNAREECLSRVAPPLILHEKFDSAKMEVVRKSFNKINSPDEWRKKVGEHERAMLNT